MIDMGGVGKLLPMQDWITNVKVSLTSEGSIFDSRELYVVTTHKKVQKRIFVKGKPSI